MVNKKQIGVFSGSFNPIHIGHLMLANYITEFTYIDEVWFVVTPHNPLKTASELANENARLKMCEIALANMKKFKVSDVEFSMPKPSYTIDTLRKLSYDFPTYDFTLVIGADNWSSFRLWKDHSKIIAENKILIYPRLGESLIIESNLQDKVQLCEAPILEISSSFIRTSIQAGKNVNTFLPTGVPEYIATYNIY